MSSVEHAAHANEAIRSLNHATLSASGHPVADVYTVLGELAQLGHRLEQTARQLSQILEHREHLDGLHLADEEARYTTASDAIDAAVTALAIAERASERLGLDLQAAQTALTWICDPITTRES